MIIYRYNKNLIKKSNYFFFLSFYNTKSIGRHFFLKLPFLAKNIIPFFHIGDLLNINLNNSKRTRRILPSH